jgi:hypothetical protein
MAWWVCSRANDRRVAWQVRWPIDLIGGARLSLIALSAYD